MTPSTPTPVPPAKLPWETPLCQPLDVAEDTQAKILFTRETGTAYGPAS